VVVIDGVNACDPDGLGETEGVRDSEVVCVNVADAVRLGVRAPDALPVLLRVAVGLLVEVKLDVRRWLGV